MSDVQIVHQSLSQIGIKVTFRWSRSVEGHEGEKLRVYSLDREQWLAMMSIVARRKAKRESLEQNVAEVKAEAGSPRQLDSQIRQGDPDGASNDAAGERLDPVEAEAIQPSDCNSPPEPEFARLPGLMNHRHIDHS